MEPMNLAADRLVDWASARAVGARAAGRGESVAPIERAKLAEDFAEVVPLAEGMVRELTGLVPGGYRSRAWVMSRGDWVGANLRGFERVLEPFARRLVQSRTDGALAQVRRSVLGAQLGALLGYMGRRVLGQYDMFLPPDDDGLLYFVGANVIGVERRFRLPEREFRLWIAAHEVTHRLQFGTAAWLKDHLLGLVSSYLDSVELDPTWLLHTLRRAAEEVRSGRTQMDQTDGMGWVFLLLTPDQRTVVRRIQACMSLLEGHASFVMNGLSKDQIPNAAQFHRRLRERRQAVGLDRAVQRAIGFDAKVRQYAVGERFVSVAVDRAGMGAFNRVWDGPDRLPTMEEIGRPELWVARVAT
jgi:coenzyme F420 biosynthesis associated uncharacterized protein